MNGRAARNVSISYDVPDPDESWELPEEDVPETVWHDAIIELLKLILRAWAARTGLDALVCSNVALRWQRDRWKVGVDPDVALYVPAPPDGEDTTSVCTWEAGHHPPRVAVEVVSKSSRTKDYLTGPEQYAASGTRELWVFDPKRFGPRMRGGPFVLQVWRRDEDGAFRQVYRGEGPFSSEEMGGWLVVTGPDGKAPTRRRDGLRLRLAEDPEGKRLWLTEAEAEAGRAAALEGEVAVLRAEIARLRGGG